MDGYDIHHTIDIVRISAILLIGVIILFGINSNTRSQIIDSVTFTFLDNPADGDTISLGDITYEFDSGDGVTNGHILVAIGFTVSETVENFKTVVM